MLKFYLRERTDLAIDHETKFRQTHSRGLAAGIVLPRLAGDAYWCQTHSRGLAAGIALPRLAGDAYWCQTHSRGLAAGIVLPRLTSQVMHTDVKLTQEA